MHATAAEFEETFEDDTYVHYSAGSIATAPPRYWRAGESVPDVSRNRGVKG